MVFFCYWIPDELWPSNRGSPWTIYWIHDTHFACFAILKFHSVNHCCLIRCWFEGVDENQRCLDSRAGNSIFFCHYDFFINSTHRTIYLRQMWLIWTLLADMRGKLITYVNKIWLFPQKFSKYFPIQVCSFCTNIYKYLQFLLFWSPRGGRFVVFERIDQ